MSNVIRSLMVRIGVDLSGVQKGLRKTAKEFAGLGKALSAAGGTLTRTLTVPVLGAIAGLSAIVVKSANAASALQRMSGVTGLSTERLQELTYVGAKLDVTLDSITGPQRSLVKAMSAAQGGADAQASAFQRLGVSVVDGTGHLRDSNAVFAEAIDALSNMTNPAERDAIALKVFGRNALALNPLIRAGGEAIARLTMEAHESGAVLSGESVAALDRFKTSLDALKLSLSTASSEIALALLPVAQRLLPVIRSSLVPAIQSFAKWLGGLVQAFASLSPGMQRFLLVLAGIVVGIGPALSSLGSLYTGLASLLKLLARLKLATLEWAGALLFLVASLGFLALVISEELNPTKNTVADTADVVGGIGKSSADAAAGTKALAGGLDKVTKSAKGLLGLAGFDEINQLGGKGGGSSIVGNLDQTLSDLAELQSTLDGITMPTLAPVDIASLLGLSGLVSFVQGWNTFWESVGAGLYDFLDQSGKGWTHLFQDVIPGLWNDLKAALAIVLLAVYLKVKATWTQVTDELKKLWNGLWTAISNVATTVTTTLKTVWDAVKTAWSTAWTGLTTAWTTFTNGIKGVWDGIGKGIRDGLNIGIDAINTFIAALNQLKIAMPPVLGGGTIGFHIPLIPRLAQGGVLDTPTLVLAGESGREAVLPLDRNTGWMDELAGRLAGVMGAGQPAFAGTGDVSVYIGNEKLDGYITRATARQALRSNGR